MVQHLATFFSYSLLLNCVLRISSPKTQRTNSSTSQFWKIYGVLFVEKRPDLWPHKYNRPSVIRIPGQLWARYSPAYFIEPIPVVARSKARNCGRPLAGIVGSNPAGGVYAFFLCVLCIVRWRSLRRADHSSREVLPSVMCLRVTMKP